MGVSGNRITIRNMLEIRADNTIAVPGCEPISSLTSNSLAENMDCRGPVIDLATALEVIPGSTVVMMDNGGGALGTIRRFFVLPDGPPPSPANCEEGAAICRTDWYAIMKENARQITSETDEVQQSVDDICNFFSLHNRSDIL